LFRLYLSVFAINRFQAVNLRDLEYLVALADTCHFGHAAERCCVSQPTLSGQIKKLEEELGVTLFERTRRSVATTPPGGSRQMRCGSRL
jgi:LysR family hydrogen peroxide-inducible transcriptional activator